MLEFCDGFMEALGCLDCTRRGIYPIGERDQAEREARMELVAPRDSGTLKDRRRPTFASYRSAFSPAIRFSQPILLGPGLVAFCRLWVTCRANITRV